MSLSRLASLGVIAAGLAGASAAAQPVPAVCDPCPPPFDCAEAPPMAVIGEEALGQWLLSKNRRPIHPQSLIDDGLEGSVVVHFVVRTDGVGADFKVARGLRPDADSAAVAMVRELAWHPAAMLRTDCTRVPVASRFAVPVYFYRPERWER